MRIRGVADDDFASIAALVNHYIATTTIHFGLTPVTAAEMRMDWIASRDRHAFLVAVDTVGVLGFAKTSMWRSRPAYRFTAEVGVYVEERAQRRGVARALYATLFAVAKAQGYRQLVAGISLPNDPSVKLHEAMGFAKIGVFPNVGYKFDRFVDVGFWQLTLSDDAPDEIVPPVLP
jgi:L-amino acid N-acyltransferase YncA